MSDADLHGLQYDCWYEDRQALRREEQSMELIRDARVILSEYDGKLYANLDDLIVWLEDQADRQAHAHGFERVSSAAALRMAANGLRDLRDGD